MSIELLTVLKGGWVFLLLTVYWWEDFFGLSFCNYAAKQDECYRSVFLIQIGHFIDIRESGIKIGLFGWQRRWLNHKNRESRKNEKAKITNQQS